MPGVVCIANSEVIKATPIRCRVQYCLMSFLTVFKANWDRGCHVIS